MKCAKCKKEKECNIRIGDNIYVCDDCAYPKPIPFEIWGKKVMSDGL